MPKIIEDLRGKIIDTAQILFIDESYEQVDMRKIAKETGIAVGTLYNYFPTKWDLFFAAFEKSWAETINKLERLTETDKDILDDKISVFIEILYKEVKNRKGMGRELFRYKMLKKDNDKAEDIKRTGNHMRQIVKKLFSLFVQVVMEQYQIELSDKAEKDLHKLISTTFKSIPFMDEMYIDECDNIQFLSDLIHSYIKTILVNQGRR